MHRAIPVDDPDSRHSAGGMRGMKQRMHAAILGAVLTALILALFLIAARWQGVLPGFGTF